jgi:hypothetical protein
VVNLPKCGGYPGETRDNTAYGLLGVGSEGQSRGSQDLAHFEGTAAD